LELDLEGNVVDVIPLSIEPDDSWRRTLDHTSAEGGRLTARLDASDALATDNRAVAVLPQREPIPVVLVSPGSLFLNRVFRSIPNLDLTALTEMPETIPAGTILVVHRTPLENVPRGRGVVVIDPVTTSDLWTLGEPLSQPLVAEQSTDSPLLAHTRLRNVLLPGARRLEFRRDAEVLLRDPTDAPIYARLGRSGGDVLVLTANLQEGDLPLRIAFPVIMKNAIESLIGDKGALRPSIATGQVTTIDRPWRKSAKTQRPLESPGDDPSPEKEPLPEESAGDARLADTSAWSLRSPSGSVEAVTAGACGAPIEVGPLDQVGVWWLGPRQLLSTGSPDPSDDRLIPISVNLANPAESDLRPRLELPGPPAASVAWGGYSPWFYLSLAALVGVTLEWFLYQRRVIG